MIFVASAILLRLFRVCAPVVPHTRKHMSDGPIADSQAVIPVVLLEAVY
jgi:hypothetical protein